ncbi:MAG: AmmeMemoRadiSam system protein A [Pseudomonadota bacterium]|nr:AmmeMemoRadiSam system protein A [Pseudomonadota bacterium]
MHDAELGRSLVMIARRAIGTALGEAASVRPERAEPAHPALEAPGATFVTLFKDGMLRGCIGTIEARRPLGIDVRANAVAAAFDDPRFPRLGADEFRDTSVEVSLLSAPEAMTADGEQALLAQLRPGIDGVVLEFAGRRATFLPQVWDTLCEPAEFLAELKRKAGLPIDFWSSAVHISRYGVTKWRESDLPTMEKMS